MKYAYFGTTPAIRPSNGQQPNNGIIANCREKSSALQSKVSVSHLILDVISRRFASASVGSIGKMAGHCGQQEVLPVSSVRQLLGGACKMLVVCLTIIH